MGSDESHFNVSLTVRDKITRLCPQLLKRRERSRPDDSSRPACFRIGSVWSKIWHSRPEPSRIRACFAQYYPGRLWKNATESESGKLVPAGCVLSESWPDDSWTPACFQTGCIWPKPDKAIQIGSGPVLHNMIQAFFGQTELNLMREVGFCIYTIRPDTVCTLAVTAITGRNQNASGSDPACLLGCTLTFFFFFFFF